jgi:hypothetical protein
MDDADQQIINAQLIRILMYRAQENSGFQYFNMCVFTCNDSIEH